MWVLEIVWKKILLTSFLPLNMCVYFNTKKDLGYNYYFIITLVQETWLCIWNFSDILHWQVYWVRVILILTLVERVFTDIHLAKLFPILVVCSLWLWSFCYRCTLFISRKPLQLKCMIISYLSYQDIRSS